MIGDEGQASSCKAPASDKPLQGVKQEKLFPKKGERAAGLRCAKCPIPRVPLFSYQKPNLDRGNLSRMCILSPL